MTDKWDFYNIAYCKVCQNVLKEEPVKKSHPAAAVQLYSQNVHINSIKQLENEIQNIITSMLA